MSDIDSLDDPMNITLAHTDPELFNESKRNDEAQFMTSDGPIDSDSAKIYLNEHNVNISAFANSLCEVLGISRHLLIVPKGADVKKIVEDAMWIRPNPEIDHTMIEKYLLDYMAERIISIFGINRDQGIKIYTSSKLFREFVSKVISTIEANERLKKNRMENECMKSAWGFDPENPGNDFLEESCVTLSDKFEKDTAVKNIHSIGSELEDIHQPKCRRESNILPTSSGQKDKSKVRYVEPLSTDVEPVKEINDARLTSGIAAIKSAVLSDVHAVKKVTISITYEM